MVDAQWTPQQPPTPKRKLVRGSPIFGLVLVLVAIAIPILFGQTSHLTCSRQADKTAACELQMRVLSFIPVQTMEVPGVQSARVGEKCSGSKCYYGVELVQANGTTPLANYSSGQSDNQVVADQINQSLQDGAQPNFSVSTPFNFLVLLGAFVFAGGGVYTTLFPTSSRHHYHH